MTSDVVGLHSLHTGRRFAGLLAGTRVGLLVLLAAAFSLPAWGAPKPVLGLWDDVSETEAESHFAHVNPAAPKAGRLRLSALGTFDSFNPFSPRGISAAQMALTYESLGVEQRGTQDFIMRGLLAESFDLAPDRTSLRVRLRPQARFADGAPVTAQDVVYTFNALVREASPVYRSYYEQVKSAEAVGEHEVLFRFASGTSRELPLIVCQMPVLPAHWWKGRSLGEPQTEAMPGSGPYRLARSTMGSRVVYERRKDWWGATLPVNIGRYNFDHVQVDYYRDAAVSREAFFAGEADFYSESNIKDWTNSYNVPPVREGRITRLTQEYVRPMGMGGIFMNTRRPALADRNVRRALSLLFDFDWMNSAFFYDSYTRFNSFFTNSPFAAASLPTPEEQAVLERWRHKVDPEVFGPLPTLPQGGQATQRDRLRAALALFEEAGWHVQDGQMVNAQGQPLVLTILTTSPSLQRVYIPFRNSLKRLGVTLNVRLVDQTQYVSRVRAFDFDLVHSTVRQSSNPGNEQRNYWSSVAAKAQGSRNYAGIQDQVLDELVDELVAAPDRQYLYTRVALLDRLLQHGCYVIPAWYSRDMRVAWWKDRIAPPPGMDTAGVDIMAWHSASAALPVEPLAGLSRQEHR
ncbi:MAG: hypothetical protein DESF_00895 [Desulfovibrio sp.]